MAVDLFIKQPFHFLPACHIKFYFAFNLPESTMNPHGAFFFIACHKMSPLFLFSSLLSPGIFFALNNRNKQVFSDS